MSILDDTIPEPNTTFDVSLLSSPGVQIGLTKAEVIIMDNDGMYIGRKIYEPLPSK